MEIHWLFFYRNKDTMFEIIFVFLSFTKKSCDRKLHLDFIFLQNCPAILLDSTRTNEPVVICIKKINKTWPHLRDLLPSDQIPLAESCSRSPSNTNQSTCASQVVLRQRHRSMTECPVRFVSREETGRLRPAQHLGVTPAARRKCTGCLRHRRLAQSYQRWTGWTCALRRR